jgi:Xaa-Pro aminopeptidase
MRRGLLAWSEKEVPKAALDARVARVQAAMADAGLGALLLYTNFPRPSAVSWLTHFVPYWSQGVLVVLPEGAPTLFISLSKRVGGWIEETAHI